MRIDPSKSSISKSEKSEKAGKSGASRAGGKARSAPRQAGGGSSELTPLNLAIAAHEDSEGALTQLTKEAPLAQDDPALERIRRIGGRIAQEAGLICRFELLRSDRVNAYAIGTLVALTQGAYRLAQNDHALAGLLAHEIAHLLLDRRKGAAAIAACRVGRGDGEFQADQLAVQLATQAGFHPHGLPYFLQAFDQLMRQNPKAFQAYTHPPASERIKRLL